MINIKIEFDLEALKLFEQENRKKFDNAISTSIKEVDTNAHYTKNYDESGLRYRSGALRGDLRTDKTSDTITISLELEYARIHNYGGYNGRGHKSYQTPKFYFSKTAQAIAEDLFQKIKDKISA